MPTSTQISFRPFWLFLKVGCYYCLRTATFLIEREPPTSNILLLLVSKVNRKGGVVVAVFNYTIQISFGEFKSL